MNGAAESPARVTLAILRRPGRYLLARWNWKSALASAAIRGLIFLRTGTARASAREFFLTLVFAGFLGAFAQAYRQVRPRWLAIVTASLVPLAVFHGAELALGAAPRSIAFSIVYSILAGAATMFLMRRGVWLAGDERTSLTEDALKMSAKNFLSWKMVPSEGPRRSTMLQSSMLCSSGRSSRRTVLKTLFAGSILSRFLPRARALDAPAETARYQRRLRVHATILLFGVPIFHREDVGDGCVTVELHSSPKRKVTALQFAAGSIPHRAHGLNRLGLMRELVVEQNARLSKASYAGFMTSSPEKSLDQGKHAIEGSANQLPCTAATGESIAGRTSVATRHFSVPGSTAWPDTTAILEDMERTPDPREHRESGAFGPLATFLFAIRGAALDKNPQSRVPFCHDGKLHQLVTRKQGSEMNGTILDHSGAKVSEFAVWLDDADPSGIPTRIDFRARSFLRLTFESSPLPEQAETRLPWVIGETPSDL